MTVINLDKKYWNYVIDFKYMENRHRITTRLIGRYMLKVGLDGINRLLLRYVKFSSYNEEDERIAQYFCGLLSSYFKKDLNLMRGEEFILGCGEDFDKGRNGEKLGIPGVDNYLTYLRKRVIRKRGG